MDDHGIPAGGRIFRYKLDFYYQQSLFYLVTLVLYAGIRGTLTFERLPSLIQDPILYIIILFVIVSFAVLTLNRMRDRKLIITNDRIIFHHRYHDREVLVSAIEWMHIGRERRVQTAGRSQIIVFKVAERRRLFRIRVGRYEREKELVREMQLIAQRVPKGKRFSVGTS